MKIIYGMLKKIVESIECLINTFLFNFMKCDVDNNTIKNIKGIIFLRNNGVLKIKKNVRINSKYSSNPIGGQEFVTFIVKNKNAQLIIDEGAGISNSTIVCWEYIYIGKDVNIGGDCKIYDTDFHSIKFEERCSVKDNGIKTRKIYIDDGVFIGTGCIILKGVTIGKHSVISAGSVVKSNIPPNQIWGGNPAKFIRDVE